MEKNWKKKFSKAENQHSTINTLLNIYKSSSRIHLFKVLSIVCLQVQIKIEKVSVNRYYANLKIHISGFVH